MLNSFMVVGVGPSDNFCSCFFVCLLFICSFYWGWRRGAERVWKRKGDWLPESIMFIKEILAPFREIRKSQRSKEIFFYIVPISSSPGDGHCSHFGGTLFCFFFADSVHIFKMLLDV